MGTVARAFLLELAQQFLLALGEVDRRLDHHLDIHVAARRRAQHGHALAAQAELVAALRAGGHVDLGAGAIDGRYLDGAAERRGRHGDRHAAMDVGAVALEDAVRLDREEDVKVARRAAAHAGLALAGQADARAVLDAGRNVDGQRLLLAHAALAAAVPARILDDAAGAVAGGAGALDGEEALLRPDAAGAVAGRAVDRLRARRRTAPAAGVARRQRRHAHIRLLALEGLLERDFEIVAQVVAAGVGALPAPAAHELAEHLVEDVGKAAGEAEIARARTAAAAILERGVAEAVIGGALLLVLQNVVGLVDVLEGLLGLLVPGIAVGVILHGHLAIGLLDLVGAGVPLDAEKLIKVLLGHRLLLSTHHRTAPFDNEPPRR